MNPTILVGMDGATFTLLNSWISKGFLPNIEKVIVQGSSGILRSVYPPLTGSAIPTFATGLNPGNTGFFEMYRKQKGSYKILPNKPNLNGLITIWKVLNHFDKQVGIFNLPYTYPPDKINGFMVSGRFTPSTSIEYTYPKSLFEGIGINKNTYKIDSPGYLVKRKKEYDNYVKAEIDNTKTKTEAALKLARKYPLDFLLFYFSNTDMAQHLLWEFMDNPKNIFDSSTITPSNGILKIYQVIDNFIGQLENLFNGKVNLFLISDHGFAKKSYDININKFLIENRFMVIKKRTFRVQQQDNLRKWIGGFLGHLNKYIIINNFIKYTKNLVKTTFKLSLTDTSFFRGEKYEVDWTKTKVYPLGAMGCLYMNLVGRDPYGIVKSGKDYTKVREQLSKKLKSITDKNGNKIIEKVFYKENLYKGKFLDNAPDIVCHSDKLTNYFYPYLDKLDKPIVSQTLFPYWSANHKLEGIFAAKGEGIKQGEVKNFSIIDLTPTLLYYMNVPIPNNMEGRVITSLFNENICIRSPKKYEPELSLDDSSKKDLIKEEQEAVEKRLKELGYLG